MIKSLLSDSSLSVPKFSLPNSMYSFKTHGERRYRMSICTYIGCLYSTATVCIGIGSPIITWQAYQRLLPWNRYSPSPRNHHQLSIILQILSFGTLGHLIYNINWSIPSLMGCSSCIFRKVLSVFCSWLEHSLQLCSLL